MRDLTQPDLALLAFAREAQEKAYAPYSDFRVGAAIFAGGEIFQGVNVENAAYGVDDLRRACGARGCGRRPAIGRSTRSPWSAIRRRRPSRAAACRQVLAEFNPEMRVVMGGRTDEVLVMRLDELLPEAFVRGYLDQDDPE